MKVTLPVRIRFGFSLALLVLLTFLGSFTLTHIAMLESHLLQIVIGIAAAGLVLLALHVIKGRSESPTLRDPNTAGSGLSEHPLSFFRSQGYWGGLMLVSAFPIFLFAQYLSKPEKPAPRPRLLRTNTPPRVVEQPKPVARTEVKFPELKLDGVVLNGPRSTVVLNGCTLSVGESVAGVKVVAIEPWGIAVEFEGRRKYLESGF